MLRNDYIQRMIEQISRALLRIMRQKNMGEVEQAAQGLDDTVEMLFGLNLNLVLTMDLGSLLASLVDPEKILVLTRLLRIEAQLANDAQDTSREQRAYRRGLELMAALRAQGIDLDDEARALVKEGRDHLPPDLVPQGL